MTLLILAVALAILPHAAPHAQHVDSVEVDAPPATHAQRITATAPPVIDGRLDDDAWQTAEVATGFTQLRPRAGTPASQRTEALVLYDDAALYVGIRAFDDQPDRIIRQLARRGDWVVSDKVGFGVDTYGDGRTAFMFVVNASEVKYDILVSDDVHEDHSWEAVWEVAVADLEEGGWSAEFRIPLSQLRFARGEAPQRWGIQFMREIARTEEMALWAPLSPEENANVSRYGRLLGVENLPSPRRFEVQPYAALSLSREPVDPANPFLDATALSADAGVDLHYGLTSTLTLSGTVNPDFGQVEADPAVVNLTAFETFFEERRPFFVEGAEFFRFGQSRANTAVNRPTYFYSRRIGRAPQRSLAGAGHQFVEPAEQTTIGAAAKVSGRVGAWSVGAMNALTLEERTRFMDQDGDIGRAVVEPLTNYTVARVRRDGDGSGTTFGGILMATQRHLDAGPMEDLLPGQAYVGGVDFEHLFADRSWAINAVVMGSHVGGSPDAIARLQRAPQRYFQRPDASHLTYDPTRTALAGALGEFSLTRIAGKLRTSTTLNVATPGFEANDLGYQTRADGYAVSSLILYHEQDPRSPALRRYEGFLYGLMGVNGDLDLTWRMLGANGSVQLANYWGMGFDGEVGLGSSLSDRLTRGGPLAVRPPNLRVSPWISTDERRRVTARLQGTVATDLTGERGLRRNLALDLSARPGPNLRFTLSPSITTERIPDQYVLQRTDAAATHTFGARYVFANLDQRVAALGIRANWTFTPTLSLQLYARPYIASGSYSRFKEFARPRSRDFDVYGEDRGTITHDDGTYTLEPGDGGQSFAIDNPDFTFRSLRANAVLRWEYRPGSTVFLVWQQQRAGTHPLGDLDYSRDVSGIFREPVHNVVMLKLTYWLGG